MEANDADRVMHYRWSIVCCIAVMSWCADKHLSVNIEGDVDVARAMEQTSTVTGLFYYQHVLLIGCGNSSYNRTSVNNIVPMSLAHNLTNYLNFSFANSNSKFAIKSSLNITLQPKRDAKLPCEVLRRRRSSLKSVSPKLD